MFMFGCPGDTTSADGTDGSDSSSSDTTAAMTTAVSMSETSNGSSSDGADSTSGGGSSSDSDSGTTAADSTSDSGTTAADSTTTTDSTSDSGTTANTDTSTDSATTTGNDTDNDTTTGGETMATSAETSSTGAAPTDTGFAFDALIPSCDLFAQDCEPGEKCMPFGTTGTWTATGCFPVDPNPGAPGDVCDSPGGATSGADTCDIGAMCWDVDEDTEEGTCVPMCIGSQENPICADPDTSCAIANGGLIILCLPTCDPLLQDCDGDQGCYPVNDSFNCVPTGTDEEGDTCEFINGCGLGLACLSTDDYGLGCLGVGCCSSFCDTDQPSDCPEPTHECVAWYEEGMAPPGYDNVGVCSVPA